MNQSQGSGHITYYDELGVAHDASSEEIRDAFRALARLLHPDQQTDPQLKAMAERQMRRLNPIYAVLSDPEKRQRYDDDLEDGFPPAIIVRPAPARDVDLRRLVGRAVWIVAIIVSAGTLVWLASENPALPTFAGREERIPSEPDNAAGPVQSAGVASPIPAPQGSDIARLRTDLRAVAAQRDAALAELARLQSAPHPQTSDSGPANATPPRTATVHFPAPPATAGEAAVINPAGRTITAQPASRVQEASSLGRRLTGFWFYTKPREGQNNDNKTLYPPEFIEATITDENGTLHGRYRSRFQIVDRAISPDVAFTFSGVPGTSAMSVPWTGPGGARGAVTLKLLPDETLQVDWSTSQLGSQQGLVSGTAVLTKRID